MHRPSHPSRFDHLNNIRWEEIIKLLIMYFSSLPSYLVPLRPKYTFQHPILKHSQPTFLPQCGRPSFTPIQNNRQNYIYLNFWIVDWKTKDSAPKNSKHSLTLLLISSWIIFWFVKVLFWIRPPFQRNCYQSSYCDFVLHSELET